jgi:hypothetical protein
VLSVSAIRFFAHEARKTSRAQRLAPHKDALLTDLLTGKDFGISAEDIHFSLKRYAGIILSALLRLDEAEKC